MHAEIQSANRLAGVFQDKQNKVFCVQVIASVCTGSCVFSRPS